MMRTCRGLVAAAGGTLAACGSIGEAPPTSTWFDAMRVEHSRVQTNSFPGARAILDGFAEAGTSKEFGIGDAVLFGIEIQHHGRLDRYLLLFEVRTPLEVDPKQGGVFRFHQTITVTEADGRTESRELRSSVMVLDVTRFDADGKEPEQTVIRVPTEPMGIGLAATSAHYLATGEQPDEEVAWQESFAFWSVIRLLDQNELLADLLFSVVERPSLWSVLWSAIQLSYHVEPARTEPVEGLEPGSTWPESCYRYPMLLTVNGEAALLTSVVVTTPRSPMNVCGGIVSIVGRRPQDPDVVARMRVLGTRRS